MVTGVETCALPICFPVTIGEDVIYNPDDPRVKDLIGNKVYYSDNLSYLTQESEFDKTRISTLENVNSGNAYPFRVENGVYNFIAPVLVKELTVKEISDLLGYEVKVVKE